MKLKSHIFYIVLLLVSIESIAQVPAGSDTQIQFNNNGGFGASPNLRWDGTLFRLEDIGNTSAKIYFRSESGDAGYIYSENWGSNQNRLVIETADDGNDDYTVIRNRHYSFGNLDVFEVHRSYIMARGSRNWGESIQGLNKGILHLNPANSTDHYGSAITFGASDRDSGNSAQAGIYTRSDGSYGTKMYFATTNAYIEGSKTAMMIDHDGNVGMGNSSPGVKLDVSGTVQSSNMGRFKGWTTGGETGLGFEIGTSGGDGYAYVYDRTNASYGTMHIQNVIHTTGNNGNVGIGTASPTNKLEVNGTIRSKEVKVEASPWPDYVFEKDYELRSLEETEAYIQKNKHLPEIPSANEIEANGLALGEMNRLLLQKIEELTLHIIEQEKRIQKLENKSK